MQPEEVFVKSNELAQEKSNAALNGSNPDLSKGLGILGKHYIPVMEWIGKFSQQQYRHQQQDEEESQERKKNKMKFGDKISKNFKNWTTHTCPLCMIDKPREEILSLCNCSHKFCYSCLNSYAISRIQDLTMVVCLHPTCGKTMSLNNDVYRYLPDSVKMKYLSNKNVFRFNKQQEAEKCPRCLQQRHSGQCKVYMKPDSVQNSFKFRQCPNCQKEASVSDGKKKIICKKCKTKFCYICNSKWTEKGGHRCEKKQEIVQLEKDFRKENGGCGDCNCDCECICCDNYCDCYKCEMCFSGCCDFCDLDKFCKYCIYTDTCGPCCILANIVYYPIRILAILTYLVMILMVFLPLLVMVIIWVVACLLFSFCIFPCANFVEGTFPLNVIGLIFYPITAFIGWFVIMYENRSFPQETIGTFWEGQCVVILDMWVGCSPQEVCYGEDGCMSDD